MQNVTWKKKLKIIVLASSSTSKGVEIVVAPEDFYNEVLGNIRLHQNIVQNNLPCFAEKLEKWEKFPAKDHVSKEACFVFQ